MMLRRYGRVYDVTEELRGADLIADAALGATTLVLEHTGYFDDLGGQARLRNVETDATEAVTYLALNDEGATLTLGAGTLAAWPAATTRVDVLPLENTRVAHVLLDDTEDEIDAQVPLALYDRIPLGTRDLEEDRESVLIATEGLWLHELADIVGQEPEQTGEYLDPPTLPPPPTSDGLAPASSPAPVITSGIGVLFVQWAAILNADPVTYDVHVSLTPGFTPTPATKVLETSATQATIKNDAGGIPLVYGTTYRVRLVARDDDGQAAAGTEASGAPIQITSPDIAVGSIVTDLLAANAITADKLAAVLILAGAIKTAEAGQRVEIDAGGVRLHASDGTPMVDIPTAAGARATFNGQILAAALDVLGSATFRGIGTLTPGAAFVLSLSVADPVTAPTLTVDWETFEFSDSGANPERRGLTWDSTSSVLWTGVRTQAGNVQARSYTTAGGLQSTIPTGNFPASWALPVGAVRVGTRVYVLGQRTDGQWRLATFDATTFAFLGETDVDTWVDITNPVRNPALGSDGTNVFVVDSDASGFLRFHRFSLADVPLFVSTVVSTGKTFSALTYLRGFCAAESGWWIAVGDAPTDADEVVHKYSTAGAYVANTQFPTRNNGAPRGVAHDGTRFYTMDTTRLVKHTGFDFTTESATYWAAFSWYHNGSGTETRVSPAAFVFNVPRRARLRVGTPEFPAGVDRARIYVNRNATLPTGGSPVRFSGFLQATDALTTRFLEALDSAGTPPENPGANGFGASTPAELRSQGGEPLVRANGFSRCKASYAGGGTMTTGATPTIRFGTEIVDTDSYHPATTDALGSSPDATYEFTLPFAGQYLVTAQAEFANDGTGRRAIQIFLNGVLADSASAMPHSGAATRMSSGFVIDAAAADKLTMRVLQTSGAGLVLATAKLSIIYLGPA